MAQSCRVIHRRMAGDSRKTTRRTKARLPCRCARQPLSRVFSRVNRMRGAVPLLTVCLLSAPPTHLAAQEEQAGADREAQLEAQVREMTQRIEELERRLEQQSRQAESAAEMTQLVHQLMSRIEALEKTPAVRAGGRTAPSTSPRVTSRTQNRTLSPNVCASSKNCRASASSTSSLLSEERPALRNGGRRLQVQTRRAHPGPGGDLRRQQRHRAGHRGQSRQRHRVSPGAACTSPACSMTA